jgi:hypothetical protein
VLPIQMVGEMNNSMVVTKIERVVIHTTADAGDRDAWRDSIQ